ncbi:hypothetical protein EUTSA_v10003740mg [Eutrema salsugineum]|uniref:Phorbol-ester/DAG-type domain-containing protein n=1 Tax=Eutrema salsugineum TaxID=72664 RepID=V4MMH5_EUTSA|nr:uncharacterized protein LOC18013067 [Eutrema salsugineum]ESQ32721.1 hypothetical protein EUTSA_v10003740mg [Eutrema salsugineum]
MNKMVPLQGHEHPLSILSDRDGLQCDACDGSYRDGYFCDECKFTVHKKCAFVFNTQETLFEHPLHVGHGLKLLTTGAPGNTDPKCHICGKNTKCLLFHCSVCNLNLDIECMVDAMCARANVEMAWHNHPLLLVNLNGCLQCDFCGLRFRNGYFCPLCRLTVHERCVSVFESPEITHNCHAKHSLKLLTEGAPDYTDLKCHLCGVNTGNLLYHCDICKFNLDPDCAIKRPPPVSLSNLKIHEPTLKLMPRLVSFVCDACGEKGDRAPYVCLECDFMIHGHCADLPRVIHINRHEHRVYYTYPLGPGEWKCGVCWEGIDWSCGAYSCLTCPNNYAVHSRCAIRDDVWDGEELDGVPEQVEDIEPFKTNDDNTITHFAHSEHNLSLNKDGIALEESILCDACVRPIGSNTFYCCSDCSFILHETCANLPKKKRHFLSTKPLTLTNMNTVAIEYNKCSACLQHCGRGFMYREHYSKKFDLLCSTITEPFIHGSHSHPLLFINNVERDDEIIKTCRGCGKRIEGMVLGCTKCSFYLDFRCATLPLTVRLDRYDDHPLTLCYGDEKASGKYWCDVCERETDPETWFYTCEHCGVTLHVFCVLGDFKCVKSGVPFNNEIELLSNSSSSRPTCSNCHCHCPGPFTLHEYWHYDRFYCSLYCLIRFKESWKSFNMKFRIPPWINEPRHEDAVKLILNCSPLPRF